MGWFVEAIYAKPFMPFMQNTKVVCIRQKQQKPFCTFYSPPKISRLRYLPSHFVQNIARVRTCLAIDNFKLSLWSWPMVMVQRDLDSSPLSRSLSSNSSLALVTYQHHHFTVRAAKYCRNILFAEFTSWEVGVTSDLNPIILSRIIRSGVHLVGWIDKWDTAAGEIGFNYFLHLMCNNELWYVLI